MVPELNLNPDTNCRHKHLILMLIKLAYLYPNPNLHPPLLRKAFPRKAQSRFLTLLSLYLPRIERAGLSQYVSYYARDLHCNTSICNLSRPLAALLCDPTLAPGVSDDHRNIPNECPRALLCSVYCAGRAQSCFLTILRIPSALLTRLAPASCTLHPEFYTP